MTKIEVNGKKVGDDTILWYALQTFDNPEIARLTGDEWMKLVKYYHSVNPRTRKPYTDSSIRVVFRELSRTRGEGGKSHINVLCFVRYDKVTDTYTRR